MRTHINYKELRALRKAGEFDTVIRNPLLIPNKIIIATMALAALAVSMVTLCHANEIRPYKLAKASAFSITDERAILAIIGEGENQGYTGMLALAGAIRNRGTLRGVFGVNAPRVVKHKYSNDTYRMAKKAWAESLRVDITKGADHWENIKAFGKPYWANSMIETFRHKDHVFFMARGK